MHSWQKLQHRRLQKLSCVIQYLRGMQDLTLMIKPGEHPRWWMDSSYSVHPDMWSHSGICMMFGKGEAYSASSKQNPNTKSSTEAELVAIDDAMGQVLWTHHFLAAQGQYVPMTTIYQDNKSMILLAEHRRTSNSKRTRHLNVQYYFITYQIKKGYVKMALCPTADMLVDFFMKPLQGTLFVHMRDQILNLPASNHTNIHRSVLGEDEKMTGDENTQAKEATWELELQ